MSFNPCMHGAFNSQPSFVSDGNISSAFIDISEATAVKVASLQAKLNKKLGPEYISQRPGPGGGPKLTYAEGWKIINLANEVFGFNGWSSSIVNLNTDFVDFNEDSRRYNVGVSAVVRITLRDGTFHEDVGYGALENSKGKAAALDKCKKEAVTDAVKRTLRNFGNLLGNCLYDKNYTQEVIKIKVAPAKLDKSMLHRRPEFDDSSAAGPSDASAVTHNNAQAGPSNYHSTVNTSASSIIKSEYRQSSAVPTHIRPNATSTPAGKGRPTVLQQAPVPANAQWNQRGQQQQQQCAPLAQMQQPQQQQQPPPPAGLAPQPPAQPQRAQAAVAPQAPAKVLVESNVDHDEFEFSYDDAFLAAIDLGECDGLGAADTAADLGHPLDAEDGVGGAIDFDEGGGMDADDYGVIAGGPTRSTEQDGERSTSGNQNHVRFVSAGGSMSAAASHAQQAAVQPAAVAGAMAPPPPRVAARPQQGQQSTSVGPNQSGRSAPMGGNHSGSSAGNTNVVKENTWRPSGAAGGHPARAATPSMGGFHYPPGVGPPCDGSRPITNGRAGTKRPAEAASVNGGRAPAGMGLAHAQGQQRRQPLAPLDTDGGDPKRLRR